MRLLTRTVLAWLLMFAIPLQGFAATAMLFCAPSHHGVVATTMNQQAAHDHHASTTGHVEHQHDNMQQVSHHGQDAGKSAANSQFDNSTRNHATPIKVGKLADGKCSACAACCTGSALLSTRSMNHVAMTGSVLIPFALESYVSHIPKGFDPPPRSILA